MPLCHGKLYITVEVFLNRSLEDPPAVEIRTATFCGYEIGNRTFESHVPYNALSLVFNDVSIFGLYSVEC